MPKPIGLRSKTFRNRGEGLLFMSGLTPYYTTPRISPDGKKVAYVAGETSGGLNDVWIRDLEFDRAVRITDQSGLYLGLSWSPDSERLVFLCQLGGVPDLCIKSLRDGSSATLLYESPNWKRYSSCSGSRRGAGSRFRNGRYGLSRLAFR